MRLFTALWPPDSVRESVAQWQSTWAWPAGAALVKPEKLHLTLHFLGEVPADRLGVLREALHVRCEPFTLKFGLPRVWGNGIAVLLPHETPSALMELHRRTAQAISDIGIALETRPYKPHVTLARRARHARPPADQFSLEWPATTGFVLVRTLAGGGYERIETFGG